MRRGCVLLQGGIESLSYYGRPKFHQRATAKRAIMRGDELLMPQQQERRRKRAHPPTQMALAQWTETLEQRDAVALLETAANTNAMATMDAFDDDVVVEPIASSLPSSSAPTITTTRTASAAKIGPDVLELVTDAFREVRERETKRRREYLYRLTHPCATDYTYAGKLLPPPPLSFGQITPESIALGAKLMLEQQYSLVKSAPSSHYFFEINNLYLEIVMVGKANAGKSSLLNALLGQPELAKTSSTPNSTREVRFYQSVTPEQLNAYANGNPNKLVTLPGGGLQLTFVDLPGFGITGMSDRWRENAIACTDSYLGVRRSVNTVLFCIDCEAGMTKSDVTYMEWLENLHGVYWIILTKCDMVPHSRVCSVMRQLYGLMTKYRRQFRKAFPMILPVSARDGTNIDVLRGLVTETSGIVPGDRLRSMLKEKAKQFVDAAVVEEEERLWTLWEERRADARRYFQGMRGQPLLGTTGSSEAQGEPTAVPAALEAPRRNRVELDLSRAGAEGRPRQPAGEATSKDRAVLQYGGTRIKLNHGVSDDSVALEWPAAGDAPRRGTQLPTPHHANDTAAPTTSGGDESPQLIGGGAAATEVSAPTGSAPQTKGPVSKYLDTLEAMGTSSPRRAGATSLRPRTARRRPGDPGHSVKVVADVGDGRFSEFKGGKPVGRLMNAIEDCVPGEGGDAAQAVDAKWSTDKRRAWRAKRYAQLASKECPTNPWAALPVLRKQEDDLRQNAAVSKMSKRDLAAYLAKRGSIISGFERFENEVTAAKYMNEPRQAKTLRQKAQWELNAVDKINYRSQPPGLLKAYGEKDSYWPTSSVIGL